MLKIFSIFIAFIFIGCSTWSASHNTEPSRDDVCSRSDWEGVYQISLTEQSGDCGSVDDREGSLNDFQEPNKDCALSLPDYWSEDECTRKRSTVCYSGTKFRTIETVINQVDVEGNAMVGQVTVHESEGSLNPVVICSSVYDFNAERI